VTEHPTRIHSMAAFFRFRNAFFAATAALMTSKAVGWSSEVGGGVARAGGSGGVQAGGGVGTWARRPSSTHTNTAATLAPRPLPPATGPHICPLDPTHTHLWRGSHQGVCFHKGARRPGGPCPRTRAGRAGLPLGGRRGFGAQPGLGPWGKGEALGRVPRRLPCLAVEVEDAPSGIYNQLPALRRHCLGAGWEGCFFCNTTQTVSPQTLPGYPFGTLVPCSKLS
jgi:hypothetical protein